MKLIVCRVRRLGIRKLLNSALAALLVVASVPAHARTTLVIGIGTQDTTTNTVTGGAVINAATVSAPILFMNP